ncbi:Uncharacterised protein [Phocoenobacter uteri]|uniref:Transferrin-binding protein B C-lobe/N-lobe beta barrel domain-containing protein n=1 Tax=Phocoenobacter uteri TaxID=146806 RepID=A0A379CAZ9_9PAST|nr:Slam-dependent surface lipoprotein [Phocoenobacter uteri]MDG6881396.1 hypothetical protein [Phocoenobacter uteri]SUB59424.1 Uncharacterised protein [Phocoenobacter uteri]
MKISKKLALSAVALSVFTSSYAANIVGKNSQPHGNTSIAVGESTVWAPFIHSKHKAGVGVKSENNNVEDKVDFGGLANNSNTKPIVDKGVTVNHLYKTMEGNGNWWKIHKGIGSFDFVQVGGADVWFGEWSENGAEGNFKGRQVFYVGDKEGTTMPKGGKATYTTYGVNKFTGNNVMKGKLIADFDKNTLVGGIANAGNKLVIQAEIKPASASFDGDALFNGTKGDSKGHFFGNQAVNLAGIAEFADKDKNTAFGGTKNK